MVSVDRYETFVIVREIRVDFLVQKVRDVRVDPYNNHDNVNFFRYVTSCQFLDFVTRHLTFSLSPTKLVGLVVLR